jgi:hypothetical protein
MPDDALDALLRRTALIVAQLAETALHHSERLDRLDALLEEQRAINRQQVAINADVNTTLARVETLLARLLPGGDNGRDA